MPNTSVQAAGEAMPVLQDLIAQHQAAKTIDNDAWIVVGDLSETLDACEGGHLSPKVQTSKLYRGKDDEGRDIIEPTYSYSEDEIKKTIERRLANNLEIVFGEPARERARAWHAATLDEKLNEFRALHAAYDKRELDIGLTAALARARAASDVVRGIEAAIVAFVPTGLTEVIQKAAWCVWAYQQDNSYLSDHDDKENPLLAALEAIARAETGQFDKANKSEGAR